MYPIFLRLLYFFACETEKNANGYLQASEILSLACHQVNKSFRTPSFFFKNFNEIDVSLLP